jgi:hypothetical protein
MFAYAFRKRQEHTECLEEDNLAILFVHSRNSAVSAGKLDFSMQKQKLLCEQSGP